MGVRSDRQVIDEAFKISDKRGNGSLCREIWVDAQERVARYNLAYINRRLHTGDNGRVIGYDNAHGHHHRHAFGQVEAVRFTYFEDVEARFEQDRIALRSPR